ncbi:MAG: hypothetical protein ABI337_00625 [Nitrososphaera sp.]
MKTRSKQGKQRYGDLEQIYKFNKRTNTILTGLEDSINHDAVKLFVQELKLAGLSTGGRKIISEKNTNFWSFLTRHYSMMHTLSGD